jgi:hypothetical protein
MRLTLADHNGVLVNVAVVCQVAELAVECWLSNDMDLCAVDSDHESGVVTVVGDCVLHYFSCPLMIASMMVVLEL